MADLSTLQTRLSEAELAYHKLLTGSYEEEVSQGDMRVKYTRSVPALSMLRGYIEQLKSEIAALGGSTGLRRRGVVVDL